MNVHKYLTKAQELHNVNLSNGWNSLLIFKYLVIHSSVSHSSLNMNALEEAPIERTVCDFYSPLTPE